MTINVPILDPLPPLYFVSLVLDRWLHSETKLAIAISLMQLKLPVECPPPTNVFPIIKEFNSIQTQVFTALYRSDISPF